MTLNIFKALYRSENTRMEWLQFVTRYQILGLFQILQFQIIGTFSYYQMFVIETRFKGTLKRNIYS